MDIRRDKMSASENNMKKPFYLYVGLALLLLVAFSGYKACRLYDDLSMVHGAYLEAQRKAVADTRVAEQMIKDAGDIIAEQSDKIVALQTQVSEKMLGIKDKDKKLGYLTQEYGRLGITDKEKIASLEAQVKIWSEKFALAERVIADKDAIIQAWAAKFNEQAEISEAWKLQYENEARLHLLCKEQVKILGGRVGILSFKSKITQALAAGAGGYILYTALRSK